MNKSTILRRILLAPPTLRVSLIPCPRSISPTSRQYATSPSITQQSFWLNMIPKPLRRSSPSKTIKKNIKAKQWNPATFFIVIFLFIGSMSIQMIALRNEFAAFTRRADARIGLLNEIIERIKNGEEVDVEGLLGTGDEQREKEWEEVLQEIEQEDAAWEQSRGKRSKRAAPENEEVPALSQDTKKVEKVWEAQEPKPKSKPPPGFY